MQVTPEPRQDARASDSRPVALITGGTTGIGLATARVLDEQGYAVTVTGQNPDTIAAAQQELPEDVNRAARRRPRARRRDLGRRGGPETARRAGRILLERRDRADAAGRGSRRGHLRRHLRGQRQGSVLHPAGGPAPAPRGRIRRPHGRAGRFARRFELLGGHRDPRGEDGHGCPACGGTRAARDPGECRGARRDQHPGVRQARPRARGEGRIGCFRQQSACWRAGWAKPRTWRAWSRFSSRPPPGSSPGPACPSTAAWVSPSPALPKTLERYT
jgi:hypothetical protein